jgi:hypothetical protein
MRNVTGLWSLAGLIVCGWIVADLLTHSSGTTAAFKGITGLTNAASNPITGK